jgi:ribonuclease Z
MPKLTLLGTSNAVPNERHENTHMVLAGRNRTILIDTASNPLPRLQAAGIPVEQVTDVILTHFHPDHVSGFPLMLMNMWLMGRKAPMTVHGLAYTVDRAKAMMDLYGWTEWPGFFQVRFQILPLEDQVLLLEEDDLRILCSPVKHFIPGIGLRFEFDGSGKVLAYSSDTEPCPQVVELARNADVLIHEASGPLPGHTSASQAARIASQAGARELVLIHYPSDATPEQSQLEASREFSGPIRLAEDFQELVF